MCIGIAIVGVVPADGGPIQFFGENGNSSHDELLSKYVPVELHNRSFKLEYIFPSTIRIDAPDEKCRQQAVDFGVAEIAFGVAKLAPVVAAQVAGWLQQNQLEHDNTTMQEANLRGANLRGADLQGADLRGANLQGADLDFSALPLWCGLLDIKCDQRLFAQVAYHLCRMDVPDDLHVYQDALREIAQKFHRFEECGGLPKREEEQV